MATEIATIAGKIETDALHAGRPMEPGETKLLLQAFELFTNASSSLETAFVQLQAHAQKLSEELAAKNVELETSLREKQAAQNYLRTILERLPCGVLVLNEKGQPELCNPMALQVLERTGRRPSGKRPRPFLKPQMRKHLADSVETGARNAEVEVPFVHGGIERTLATSGTPLTDDEGRKIGTLHILRDVTEVKALQEQGKRVERLSAMGEMAVELAHEIRNPLGSIELFASLLVKDLSGDMKRWAENIRIGIRSLNTIVSNMLQFANPGLPLLADIDLHEVIQEILKFTEAIMQQRQVRIETSLAAEDPVISGDHELLKQMMLNLIFNAMKAMPSQGSLTITTRNIPPDSGAGHAGCLELQIRDTGIGIPTENLNRIFDPFFTTNQNGTGLGLSVVHQIVQKHLGTIRVESKVNMGTTFTITFGDETAKE
jgi:nitrogen fixation/metabolism regulation signal transduction histidine kinase